MDLQSRIDLLQVENDTLRARIDELERLLVCEKPLPIEWRLTGQEAVVVAMLLRREMATKESIYTALYSARIDANVQDKIIDVFICKIRKKLAPFGIEISTVWGQGYVIDKAARERFGGAA